MTQAFLDTMERLEAACSRYQILRSGSLDLAIEAELSVIIDEVLRAGKGNPYHVASGDKGGQFTTGGGGAGKKAPGKHHARNKRRAEKKKAKRKGKSDKSKLSDRERKGKPKTLSPKAALAQKHMSITDKHTQDYTKANEHVFSSRMGGTSYPDNAPIDVHVKGGGVKGKDAGIELKTLVHGKNDKITMSSGALARKDLWEKTNNSQMHTVALDHRHVFEGGKNAALHSGHEIYYKRGVGSFRIGSMYKVKDEAELKVLLKTPYDKLPKAAQGPIRQVKRSMAQYASTEEKEMHQVASNQGWHEFCEWAGGADDSPELDHLVENGWANDFPALAEEISRAIEEDAPDDDVLATIKGLLSFLEAHNGAEMVAISNGITSADN